MPKTKFSAIAAKMKLRQLYTDQKEFEELRAEATAMNTIAKICIAGAEAEQRPVGGSCHEC